MKTFIAAALAVACLGFAGAGSAETCYINTGVNLRAGPGKDFPRISMLARGRQVDVRGCIRSGEWCDVAYRGGRGWVSARYLDINFEGRRRGYWANRQRARIPTVSLNMNSYWDENYRNQRFNSDRARYRNYGPYSESANSRDDRGDRNDRNDGRDDCNMRDDRIDRGSNDCGQSQDDRNGRDDRTDRDRGADNTRGDRDDRNQNCDDPRTTMVETCPTRRP